MRITKMYDLTKVNMEAFEYISCIQVTILFQIQKSHDRFDIYGEDSSLVD